MTIVAEPPAYRTILTRATVVCLGSISALHVLWGRGSTFPFRDRQVLNDQVIGRQASPSPTACNGVACLLAAAAVVVVRAERSTSITSRLAAETCGLVFAVRAILGFAGRTDLAVPGSTSASFRRNDRRVFAPICALLAAGATTAAWK